MEDNTSQEATQTKLENQEPQQEDSSPPEVGEIKEGYPPYMPPELEEFPQEEVEHQYEEYNQEHEAETYSQPAEEDETAQTIPSQHKFDPEDIITHNIFVGDLKSDVVEQDLFDAFRPCGEIHSVHIFRDPHTQEQKGFGFVHFMSREAQQKALSDEFKNIPIKVRNI